jgi:hypothetical protein
MHAFVSVLARERREKTAGRLKVKFKTIFNFLTAATSSASLSNVLFVLFFLLDYNFLPPAPNAVAGC